jgi:hypothetical protein
MVERSLDAVGDAGAATGAPDGEGMEAGRIATPGRRRRATEARRRSVRVRPDRLTDLRVPRHP